MADQEKKRGPFLNIGTVIFGAIFVYIIITLVIYLSTDRVSSYMVTAGTLSDNDDYTALAIREESVVPSPADGYVTYYVQDGTKSSKNDLVCSVGDSKSGISTENLAQADADEVRQLASGFSKAYDPDDYSALYDLKYAMNATVVNDADSQVNGTPSRADTDGVIAYTTDGKEGLEANDVTAEDFDTTSTGEKQLRTDDTVSAGDPIYRIVSSDTWQLVFPVSDRQYSNLASRTSVKIRFHKDGQTETGDLSMFDKDNVHYALVTLYSGMVRYCDDRYLDIELVTNTMKGLKIPISAVVNKEFYTIPADFLTYGGEDSGAGFLRETASEDGKTTTEFVETDLYERTTLDSGTEVCYVDESDFDKGDIIVMKDSGRTYTVGDTATLEGVYCTNRGYAQFRKINILEQNEEFCIVEEGTDYGISQYDYIVRDGSDVNESQITAAVKN